MGNGAAEGRSWAPELKEGRKRLTACLDPL